MKSRRNTNLLVEPPSVATGDIAFNLIVFFLVCASSQPDSGRKQVLPQSNDKQQAEKKSENITVKMLASKTTDGRSINTVSLNGDPIRTPELLPRLQKLLANKKRPEDRVVVVQSAPATPYEFWIEVSVLIESAGGMVTIQREEEQTVTISN